MNADLLTHRIRRRGRFSIEIGDGRFVTVSSKRTDYGRGITSRNAELAEEREKIAADDEALRDRILGLLRWEQIR